MLISHEVPKELLVDSLSFNDYDYVLAHFYDQDVDYRNFYKGAKRPNSILDNSIMELGEAFSFVDFSRIAQDLRPDIMVIPDVFNDRQSTIENVKKWERDHRFRHSGSYMMGVVQGSTYEELEKCYLNLFNRVDVIGINFGSGAYDTIKFCDDKHMNRAFGRHYFISSLFMKGFLKSKYIHLLGANVPQEFSLYSAALRRNIMSMDSSNPVVAGMTGIKISETKGLSTKPLGNINDLFYNELDDKTRSLIFSNIESFRKFVKV